MARDEHLLYSASLRPAALRLYAWTPPTISLGYFQRYADLANLPTELRELPVVRRPTGGGAILHDQEVTYCLVVDDSLPVARQPPVALYRLVHECWRAALAGSGQAVKLAPDHLPMPTPRGGPFFCFAKPGPTDLLLDGEKLLGSAQRRIPGKVLQHGSLLLGKRFASHPGADLGQFATANLDFGGPGDAVVDRWCDAFIERLASALELEIQPSEWTAEQLSDVKRRRQRYAGPEWTRQR